ncbi:hypothetical protein [Mycoplasma nasistruthionis]|uniref:hypothetical protein n=1 Tax=Mycoplasma nasistruthionis TaxID=353852 RepID=UPI001305177C|nr:hypothetical protein [Mycoplasma nasistruthionis]
MRKLKFWIPLVCGVLTVVSISSVSMACKSFQSDKNTDKNSSNVSRKASWIFI